AIHVPSRRSAPTLSYTLSLHDALPILFIGNTATPMQAAMHEMEGRPYEPARFIQADDVAEMVISALSVAPSAEVTDIHIRPALRSEEHTSELQSRGHLVCRLLLEKKKK